MRMIGRDSETSPAPMFSTPYVVFEDGLTKTALAFERPTAIIQASRPADVPAAFAAMQAASEAGAVLAGFASYELGNVLEPKLGRAGLPQGEAPLLRFGVFDGGRPVSFEAASPAAAIRLDPRPAWSFDDYVRRFDMCRDYIFAGDVYQINLTFPLHGRWSGDPLDLYRALRLRQPVAFGGVIALGDETIVSLSPEIFFAAQESDIRVRPMKGTAPRGRTPADDAALAHALRHDVKNRAENLMIVDLLRNDLSRISEIGSVKVTDLYTVSTYPTVHQMTSGVTAKLKPGVTLAQIFAGLFPCGSVTGAPKVRAMEIIRELESGPRGVYCGAIGLIEPGGAIRFNVAIRTLALLADGSFVYNVGSAIVADSNAADEYRECLLKAKFLT